MNHYILKNKIPVKTEDFKAFCLFMEDISSRRVSYDSIKGINISTVFLGLDHNFNNMTEDDEEWKPKKNYIPILFETMIFNATFDNDDDVLRLLYNDTYIKRSCTWEEAETEHRLALEVVNNYIDNREKFEESMKSNIFRIKQ